MRACVRDTKCTNRTLQDDYGGIGDENPTVQKDCALSDAEISAMRAATSACWARLNNELILPSKKFIWQALFYGDKPRPTNNTCSPWMRYYCALDRSIPLFMECKCPPWRVRARAPNPARLTTECATRVAQTIRRPRACGRM